MRNKIGLLLIILLLIYGITRMFVGGALLAQTFEMVNTPDLIDAISEVKKFINERVADQIIPFTATSYFTYILVMGMLLTTGAIGVIARKKLGFILLWIYIASHAALFVNFQEINPKLFVLVLQIILLLAVNYLLPPKSSSDNHLRSLS